MKKIVLMTDFSDNAKNAIKYGISLFGNSTEYILVHTYEVRKATGSFGKISDILRQDAIDGLDKELAHIKNQFSNITDLNIATICQEGDPVDVLNHINKDLKVDLVIMGTKGASGLSKIFMGSVTAAIIRETKYPVLSVPEKAIYKSIDKIVFAADLESNSSERLTNPIKSIASKSKSEVLLLHILKNGESSEGLNKDKLNELQTLFAWDNIEKTINFVTADNTAEGIEKFCIENKADLLAVIARHNSFFDKFFHKSISQELAFSLKMPLLTMQN